VRTRGGVAAVGMTLIEIMVVIALIMMLGTGVAFGVNAVPRTRLRASASRVAAALRLGYVHALTTGRTTRLAFDVGRGTIRMEDTDDAHTLDANDPLRAGGAEPSAVEARAIERARLQTDLRPRANRASFTAVSPRVFRARDLERGVVFHRLYSQHETEPRSEGGGQVYFFPGGRAERAVVQVRNDRGEIYSVALNPLTGRTEIFDRPIEPPTVDERDARDDTERDERERDERQRNEQGQ
jgi:Tfp pilus assembly protein FimT